MDLLGHHDEPTDHHHHGPPPPRPTSRPPSRPTSPAVPARPQHFVEQHHPVAPPGRPAGGPPARPNVAPSIPLAPQENAGGNKGFAGIFGGPSPTAELDALDFAAQQQQQAAAVPEEPPEEIDLLGLPKPRTKTKNDILKLFEKKEEKGKDLLAEDVFDNGFLVDVNEHANAGAAPAFPMVSETNQQPGYFDQQQFSSEVMPENSFNTQVYQQPAFTSEAPVYPEIKSPVFVHSDPIAIPDRSGEQGDGHEEEFDAFSSRFESVGREDTLMVETDPFDPFSGGTSAKGPAPHKQDSHDSDEEPEFALSIK